MNEAAERLDILERKHRNLSEEVRRLERRAYLTPDEQRTISDLKKQKLQAKDQIFALKRDR